MSGSARRFGWLLVAALGVSACGAAPAAPAEAPPQAPSAEALAAQGRSFAKAGDGVRAEQYLVAALRAGARAEQLLPELLRVCIVAGRLQSALGHALPYLKAHPDEVALRYLVATIYLGLEQAPKALQELERISSTDPHHAPSAYLAGAIAWDVYGDAKAARRHFERYLRLAPRGAQVPEVVAWLREQQRAPLLSLSAPDEAPAAALPQRAPEREGAGR